MFYSYEAMLRDNGDLMSDQLKAEAHEKAEELRAALADRAISPDQLQKQIDTMQQTLFAIGSNLYQQANLDDFAASEAAVTDATGAADSTDVNGSEPENAQFDDDATVTADYEAID